MIAIMSEWLLFILVVALPEYGQPVVQVFPVTTEERCEQLRLDVNRIDLKARNSGLSTGITALCVRS